MMLSRRRDLLHRYDSRHHHALLFDAASARAYLNEHGVPVVSTFEVCRDLLEVKPALERIRGRSELTLRSASDGRRQLCLRQREPGGWRGEGGDFISETALAHRVEQILFQARAAGTDEQVLIEQRVEAPLRLGARWSRGIELRVVALEGQAAAIQLRSLAPALGLEPLPDAQAQLDVDVDRGTVQGGPSDDLRGQVVPEFRELVAVALRAARQLPIELIGVDVALDARRGALVVGLDALAALKL